MKQKYYAAHNCANYEIAIFNSREQRDEWVNHQDWFSKEFQVDDRYDKRVALRASEAYNLIGKALYNKQMYIKDDVLDDVVWAFGM